MLRQEATQRYWGALIEKNAHLRWGKCASRSMLQNGANLLNGDAWKPLNELGNERAVLKVLK